METAWNVIRIFVSSVVRTAHVKNASPVTSSTLPQTNAKLALKGAMNVPTRQAVFSVIRQSTLDRGPSEANAHVIRRKAGIKMMKIHSIVNA